MHPSTILTPLLLLLPTTLATPVPVPAPAFEVNNFRPISDRQPLPSSCDVAKASQPPATTPLPQPAQALKLYTVLIGRGTQNYTCTNLPATSAPLPQGAVADLYNASCIAASYPDLLQSVATLAYELPNTPKIQGLTAIGYHYFTDATTPNFLFFNSGYRFAGKKVQAVPAPANAPVGSVPWLKLQSTDAPPNVGNLEEVYRLTTAGGAAPATCAGKTGDFQVPYAASYWFYQK